jgi:hypothetical protein
MVCQDAVKALMDIKQHMMYRLGEHSTAWTSKAMNPLPVTMNPPLVTMNPTSEAMNPPP